MDYREPNRDNRRNLFKKWFVWQLEYKDCDPAVWCMNYINNRFEHNDEQRLWFAWLYGNTYYLPTAWVLLNEFPDYELATLDRLNWWNTSNYKRLRYQTDCKWSKGHLPKMFESYQKFINTHKNQRTKLESLYGNNEIQNFDNIWEALNKELFKFGRYSVWFYMQQLKHTANIAVKPSSLMLSDYSGSKSHRNGLLLALGRDEECDQKLTLGEYNYLECEAEDILDEIREKNPLKPWFNQIDLFFMESALCSFKKLFRTHHGRYLGYYLDRQAEEILQCESDGWSGIEWNVLHQAREETLEPYLNRWHGPLKERFSEFMDTGNLLFPEEKEGMISLEDI